MRTPSILLVFVFLIGFSGCQKWVNEDNWGGGYWSEDDQALAVMRVLYERENKTFGGMTRNWRFKVYTAPANNVSQTTQRGAEMQGSIEKAYYMRGPDYVVTVARLRSETGDTIRVDQFLANGTVRQLRSVPASSGILSCSGESWSQEITRPVAMIPSPDGSSLAFVRLTLGCDGMSALVELIDPGTGSTQSSESISLLPTMSYSYLGNGTKLFNLFPRFAWNDSGAFMLGFEEMEGEMVTENILGWVIESNGSRTDLPDLDSSCFMPATTSDYYSATGQFLNSDPQDDSLWVESPGNPTDVFGCQ